MIADEMLLPVIDGTSFSLLLPAFLGVSPFDASDDALVRTYFDWNALLQRWQVSLPYAEVLDLPDAEAPLRKLVTDVNGLIDELLLTKQLIPIVTFGVWRAASDGDALYVQSESGTKVRLLFERQPTDSGSYCPADFIKPASGLLPGESDYVGGYRVTLPASLGLYLKQLRDAGDDYRAFLLEDVCIYYRRAVADYLHYRLRRFIWAYCDDDDLSNDEISQGLFQGIRVRIGGKECPGFGLAEPLATLLGLPQVSAGREMLSASEILLEEEGLFFAHPGSRNLPDH